LNSPATAPPRLYLVTDRQLTGGRPLPDVVEAALRGIAGSGLAPHEVAVQLREKDLSGRALTELARALRDTTAAAGVRLFVNDRIDVALAAGADGVHLGEASLPPADARAIAPALAVAISAHRIDEVRAAGGQVAFAVFGPIYDTPSKRRYGPPIGLDVLDAAARVGLPLVAIGGIDSERADDVRRAGAYGVACIRAVMAAADPTAALRVLARAIARTIARAVTATDRS
jgi:thiamine-phosphate pyrophosphorylase